MGDGVLVRTQFDPASDRSPAVAVVEALGLITSRHWERQPLAQCVDTDSLDALFSPSLGSLPAKELQLSFPYEEWLVTVSGSGEIVIRTRPDHEITTG